MSWRVDGDCTDQQKLIIYYLKKKNQRNPKVVNTLILDDKLTATTDATWSG